MTATVRPTPVPTPPRASVEVERLRLIECLLGLSAVALAGGSFSGFFGTRAWLPWSVAAVAVGGAVVWACLLRDVRWWATTAIVAVVTPLLAHIAGYWALTWYGLPTLASLRAFGTGLWTGLPKVLAVGLPADFDGDLVVLPLLAVGAAGAATVALVLRTRRVTPVVLPALVVFLLGLSLTASRGGAGVVLTGTLVLVLLVLLLLRSNRVAVAQGEGITESDADAVGVDLAARRRHSTYGRVLLGLPVVVVVTAVAVAGWLLPIAHGGDRVDPRTLYRPPFDVAAVLSPLVSVRPQLVGPDQPLFTVRVSNDTDPPLDRVRVAALDTFDGSLWTRSRTFQVTGTTLPDPEPLPSATEVRLDVRVERLGQSFLPVTGDPVRFDGSDFAFDRATGTVVSTRAVVSDYRYSTSGMVRLLDRSALDVAPVTGEDAYTDLPGKPPWVDTRLEQVLQGRTTSLGELMEIETFLRNQPYSSQAPPGHSYGALFRTLLGEVQGQASAEQLASAFAVLARAADYPTRIAVGYRLRPEDRDGDVYRVSTHDAHAWPEVHLQDHGWVPFEPTTEREAEPLPRDPDVILTSTDVPPPPADSTGTGSAGEDEERTSAERIRLVAVLVAIGVITVLALIVLLKQLRRQQRARRRPPARRVVGAWREVVDRLTEAGVQVPVSHTAGEVARDLGGGPAAPVARHVAELASLVAGAVFAYEEPDGAAVRRAWELERRIHGDLGATLPIAVRVRSLLDPRPLLPRRVRPPRRRRPADAGRSIGAG